ncbi:unnamed protein product [Peniophora sp. CBMAI 1063]|nr:unnamed protein product [Peniophora sp. CBMAI 1063]
MGKHARKRQRTDDVAPPLGSELGLADEAGKDDEERRLESLLFGKPYIPCGEAKSAFSQEEDGVVGAELEAMLDADLFFLDHGAPAAVPTDDRAGSDAENALPTPAPSEPPQPAPLAKPRRKAPAWEDPDDGALQVDLAATTRLRKLRDAPSEDAVAGREYERRLRRQFEKINPTPIWATNARKKRRRSGADGQGDEVDTEMDALLSGSGGIVGQPARRTIEPGTLNIERLRDANQSAPAEGEVKAIQFHPSPQVPLLLTASADRRVRLYNVDGHTNPHLQTLHIPDLPTSSAHFHPTGSSILLTGPRPYYYSYDLQSGTTLRSPRGLWGTTFSRSHTNADELSMEIAAFNPSGDVLAVAGRRGYVHLVDWRAGLGQVVASVKGNTTAKSMWWSGNRLMTLGEDSEVYLWDVGERRCARRWKDDGGFGATVLTGDRPSSYLAVGSKSGIVNVYGGDAFSASATQRPKPFKAISNLTTAITSAKFNHDSQLLALASNAKKDQLRLIHLPSLTAFSNWPTAGTPLGHVSCVEFSANSEYLAMGNGRGRVLLYHLRDFTVS